MFIHSFIHSSSVATVCFVSVCSRGLYRLFLTFVLTFVHQYNAGLLPYRAAARLDSPNGGNGNTICILKDCEIFACCHGNVMMLCDEGGMTEVA